MTLTSQFNFDLHGSAFKKSCDSGFNFLLRRADKGQFINGALDLFSQASDLEVKKVERGTLPPQPAVVDPSLKESGKRQYTC